VLEGVVFAFRHAIEALLDELPSSLIMTGGGTRSRPLCQLFADITGIRAIIPTEAEHAGLYGALLSAQVQSSQAHRHTLPQPVQDATVLEPDMTSRKRYDRLYQLFRGIYPALSPTFRLMSTSSDHV
jgi:sugar (pentulose or hexulose) kinase